MNVLSRTPVMLVQSKFCLYGIVVGLAVLHLILTWRVIGDTDRLIVNVLFWGAILCLLWRRQHTLNLNSDIFSSFFGFLLTTLVLLKSISLFWFETSFLKLSPLLLALGLGMLVSGLKGLKQYWRELLLVLLLCLPDNGSISQTIQELFQVTTLTAKFAAFVLWYTGFEVLNQGENITLANGSVMVLPACTGINMALVLLKLALVFILVFPIDWRKKILVLIGAVCIAFVSGGMRVALMAVVVSNREVFEYWHGSSGDQIFSTIAILSFGLLCHLLLHLEASASPDSVEWQKQ